MRPALLLVMIFIPQVLPSILCAREWTDSTGKFRVEAELVIIKDKKAYLEREGGKVVGVPLANLCKNDLRYLMSLPEQQAYFKANPIPGIQSASVRSLATAVVPVNIQVDDESKVGEIRRFGDLGWGVESLAFSPDGRFLAAGKMDRALMLFDVDKQQRVAFLEKLEGLGQVTAVTFSPDGRKLLAGGYTGRIQVYNVDASGSLTEANRFVGHSREVSTISISRDGTHVLSGGAEKMVRCWTMQDAREQFAVDGFSGAVKATYITRGGKQGLASDGDIVALIDMTEGKAIQTMKLGKRAAQTVAIAPDGSRVVVNDSYALQSWGIQSGQGYPTLQDREIQWFATFLPNSKHLLSGGRGKVNLWNMAENKKIYEFDTASPLYVQTIAASPDNRHFAAITSAAGQDLQVFRMPADVAK